MKFKLRDYQSKAVEQILTNNVHNEFVISNPTGTGKMMIFIELMNGYERQGHKCLYLTGFGVLINDLKNRFGKPINVLKGANNEIHNESLIYISTYQTMQNRLDQVDLKNCILLLDESKAFDGKMYNKIINDIKPSKIIHSSATPYDSRGIFLYKDAINVKTISIKEAEDKNYRVPLKTYVPIFTNGLNLKDIDKVGTEYNQEQLSQVMTQDWYIKEFKKWINSIGIKDRTTLVVTTSIDQTELTYKQIDGIDYLDIIKKKNDLLSAEEDHKIDISNKIIKARVHSKRNEKENRAILDAFYDGKIDIVVSASKLTTGYDNPRVDTFVALRPTLQRNLFIQMISRAIRPFEGKKHADFFDLGNLTMNHGLYIWEDDFQPDTNKIKAKKVLENLSVQEIREFVIEDGEEISAKTLCAFREKIRMQNLEKASVAELYKIFISDKDFFRMFEAGARLYSHIWGLKKSTSNWVYEKYVEIHNQINNQDLFKKAIQRRMKKIIFLENTKIFTLFTTLYNIDKSLLKHFSNLNEIDISISNRYRELYKKQNANEKDFIYNEILKEIKNEKRDNILSTLIKIYIYLETKNIKKLKFAGLYYFTDWVLGSDSPYQLHLIELAPDNDFLDLNESEILF
jgi:superfamily II DNA or RNA helicase